MQRIREISKIFSLLIYFPNGHEGQSWARSKPGASWSPRWVQGPTDLLRLLSQGHEQGARPAGTWTKSHVGCWYCRQQLTLAVPQRWPHPGSIFDSSFLLIQTVESSRQWLKQLGFCHPWSRLRLNSRLASVLTSPSCCGLWEAGRRFLWVFHTNLKKFLLIIIFKDKKVHKKSPRKSGLVHSSVVLCKICRGRKLSQAE